jgi:polysaccharide export outer membrane protein
MDIMEIHRKMGACRGIERWAQKNLFLLPPVTPSMDLNPAHIPTRSSPYGKTSNLQVGCGLSGPQSPRRFVARCAGLLAIALTLTATSGSLAARAQDTVPDTTEPLVTEPLRPESEPNPATELEPDSNPQPEFVPFDELPLPDADPVPGSVLIPPQPQNREPFFFDPALSDRIPGIPNARDFATYRLGPGDGIFVSSDFPELSFQAALDIQGNVVVPLEGTVSLNGLTMVESEALITEIYDQYVYYPEVSITLIAQRGVEVTILGEVVRPGFYPLASPEVTAALLTAGGTTVDADLREVRIQRQLPNGELLEGTFDLFTPLKVGSALPDIPLQDGDVILVERLDPGERSDYDSELVSRTTLAQPQIIVRFLNYGSGGGLDELVLPNGSRFVDAIAGVGVNPDLSNVGEVALVRFDPEAGEAVTAILDGGAAFRGDPTQNPPLQHNDVIIMERTLLARITYGLSTFTQPFRDVLGFLLFFDSLSDSATNLFGPGAN